ncbi:MAG: EFR1 family ferrodoxin [Acetivibrionales bacterium]|jgi:flavodoxin/ferredoxin
MNIQRLCLVYFSPTGTTKKVLRIISKVFDVEVIEYDLTDYAQRDKRITFKENDLVVFGIPVYSGRVPMTMAKRLENVAGNATPMAIVATYGSRDYNDALLELKNLMEPKGFKAIGAIAIASEHSVVQTIATGRPNQADKEIIRSFGEALSKKINAIHSLSEEPELYVNGKTPYRKYMIIPMIPKCTSKCNNCKACAKSCPVGAIDFDHPKKTDKYMCIRCMRCTRICASNARHVGAFKNWVAKAIMNYMCKSEKKPEIFLNN